MFSIVGCRNDGWICFCYCQLYLASTIFTPLIEDVHLYSSGHERLAPHSSPAVLRERKGRAWPKIQQFHCRIQSYGRHNHWYISATPCQDQVVASGKNGTINGQGQVWWDKYRAKELQFTRGYLLELLYSDSIIISNVTFVDSPSWNLHPTYCTYGSKLWTRTPKP